jgi:hypothetical protein
VQTDGWLIQHVHHPDQPRANLRREADALRFRSRLVISILVEQKIHPEKLHNPVL